MPSKRISKEKCNRSNSRFARFRDFPQVVAHVRKTASTLVTTFDDRFNTSEKFRQVHLFADASEIRLDLCILEIHLRTGVIRQRLVQRIVNHESAAHLPISAR